MAKVELRKCFKLTRPHSVITERAMDENERRSRSAVYVLVAIVKKRLKLEASLYTLLQVLSVTLFEKLPLDQTFTHDAPKGVTSQITNQLDLFAY